MGIQDRDYMRERGRGELNRKQERRRRRLDDLFAGTDRPFAPAKETSLVWIVVFWILVAAALYLAYQSALQQPGHAKPRAAMPTQVPQPLTSSARLEPPSAAEPAPVVRRETTARAALNAGIQVHETARTPSTQARQEPPPTGGTIYLCKAYNGSAFWAQSHCNQHQALIDSMVSVPAGMPFEQQVELAQQRRREVARTVYAPPTPTPTVAPAATSKVECEALDARVNQLDAMARQPQSAQMQDWIRGERKAARDRQFGIRC